MGSKLGIQFFLAICVLSWPALWPRLKEFLPLFGAYRSIQLIFVSRETCLIKQGYMVLLIKVKGMSK